MIKNFIISILSFNYNRYPSHINVTGFPYEQPFRKSFKDWPLGSACSEPLIWEKNYKIFIKNMKNKYCWAGNNQSWKFYMFTLIFLFWACFDNLQIFCALNVRKAEHRREREREYLWQKEREIERKRRLWKI